MKKEAFKLCADLCLNVYKYFDIENKKTDTQVLISDDVIVFRGTESLKDWKTNLDISFINTPIGRVHKGFWNAYQSVKKLLPKKASVITGHSLGGALALLCGLDRLNQGEDVKIITFGQPRVLDKETALLIQEGLYKEKIFRFINNNDIVPRIPSFLHDFKHVGNVTIFSYLGRVMDNTSFYSLLFDRLRGRWQDFGKKGLDGIKDHDMNKYKELVYKMVN